MHMATSSQPTSSPPRSRWEQFDFLRTKWTGFAVSEAFAHAHKLGLAPGARQVFVQEGLAYGDDSTTQAFDLFLPAHRPAEGLPLIVMTHGGGWVTGHRKWMAVMARKLAARGFCVATPGYRLQPKWKLQDQLTDMQAMLAAVIIAVMAVLVVLAPWLSPHAVDESDWAIGRN